MKNIFINAVLLLTSGAAVQSQQLPTLPGKPKTPQQEKSTSVQAPKPKARVEKPQTSYSNYTKAELENLVHGGNTAALYELGNRYFLDGEYKAAINCFSSAYRQAKNYRAAFMLSYCYYMGLGTEKNYESAAAWAKLAANDNYAPALYRLGTLYNDGLGVNQSNSDAAIYFKKAYDIISGKPESKIDPWEAWTLGVMDNFGYYIAKNEAEAFRWYQKSANEGCVIAQHNLGVHYRDGIGTYKNYTEAFNWFSKAARAGFPLSQNEMGVCYHDGHGVATDRVTAFNWYVKAAVQGLAVAELNLAICYEDGDGVAANLSEAIKWYRLAAAQGDTDARDALRRLNQ